MTDYQAPSVPLLLAELRSLLTLAGYGVKGLDLAGLPRGQGQPIMLIPGFGATDKAMAPLRKALTALGYQAYGWQAGRNLGMKAATRSHLEQHLKSLAERHQQPVVLIGWSLGGVFARELARAFPEQVAQVFSLGSPISGHPNANNVTTLFALTNPKARQAPDMEAFRRREQAPPVPCVAIYSKSDGIVSWRASQELPADNTENVQVKGPHTGFPWNPQVLAAIARRLPGASNRITEEQQ